MGNVDRPGLYDAGAEREHAKAPSIDRKWSVNGVFSREKGGLQRYACRPRDYYAVLGLDLAFCRGWSPTVLAMR